MFRVFEKYLEQLGERRGMLLLGAVLVWVSILLSIFAYGLGMGVIAVWRISWTAYDSAWAIFEQRAFANEPWHVFMGVVVWLLMLLLIVPLRAARRVLGDYRRQQRLAQKALTEVEEGLFAAGLRSSNVHTPQERLARRALNDIETRVVGAPQPADLTIEERLIKLRD